MSRFSSLRTSIRMAATVGIAAVGAAACSPPDLPAVAPLCHDVETVALLAQSVPGAEDVPCLDELPPTVQVRTLAVDDTGARFALAHAVAGDDALVVTFASSCHDRNGEVLQPSADDGAGGTVASPDAFVEASADGYLARTIESVPGGCIVAEYDLSTSSWAVVLDEVEPLLLHVSRATLASRLRDLTDGRVDLDRNR